MSRLRTAAGTLTALGVATVAFVGTWEGKRNHAYRDVVGVWTICYGETRGVKRGDYKTDAQCDTMLADALVEYEMGIRKCLRAPDDLPDEIYLPAIDLAYNIGIAGFCRSSVARHANAGDLDEACGAFMLYVKGGRPLRVIKGLVNRRKAERKLCSEVM